MKKTILLSSILAVGAAFADATVNSTEVGVMGVAMPKQATLIAVPFLGYDVTDITIADMVNTAELALGSKLYAPNGSGQYNVWELKSGEGNTRFWDKTSTNVTIGNAGTQEIVTPNANTVTTARGEAFWLEPANGTLAENCYLLGKPADTTGTSVAVADKWNLIGNTSGQPVTLPDTGFERGDMVSVPQEDGKLLTYNWKETLNWWLRVGATPTGGQKITIQPGQGIWFFAKGSNRTITWKQSDQK